MSVVFLAMPLGSSAGVGCSILAHRARGVYNGQPRPQVGPAGSRQVAVENRVHPPLGSLPECQPQSFEIKPAFAIGNGVCCLR